MSFDQHDSICTPRFAVSQCHQYLEEHRCRLIRPIAMKRNTSPIENQGSPPETAENGGQQLGKNPTLNYRPIQSQTLRKPQKREEYRDSTKLERSSSMPPPASLQGLPRELRIQILEYLLPDRDVITLHRTREQRVYYDPYKIRFSGENWVIYYKKFPNPHNIPLREDSVQCWPQVLCTSRQTHLGT